MRWRTGSRRSAVPIVFDPVMVATSGSALADAATIAAFERLMRDRLGGHAEHSRSSRRWAARRRCSSHGCHLVAKGGHAEGDWIVDRLLSPSGPFDAICEAKRFQTEDTHGTGCTLSSALACGLGAGLPIERAFAQAIRFVRIAILEAPGLGGQRPARPPVRNRLPVGRTGLTHSLSTGKKSDDSSFRWNHDAAGF